MSNEYMYIPTCAAKLDKKYSAYIQGRGKKLNGTAGIESDELCCSANLRNFHTVGGNIGGRVVAWGSMWV